MSISSPAPAPAGPAPEAAPLQDQAVTFLQAVAPRHDGDRARAFAALLRALTTPVAQR